MVGPEPDNEEFIMVVIVPALLFPAGSAVFGAIFIVIGGLLLSFGVRDLRRGVARDKFGREVSGGMATLISVVRVIGGVIAGGFGLFKLVMGQVCRLL